MCGQVAPPPCSLCTPWGRQSLYLHPPPGDLNWGAACCPFEETPRVIVVFFYKLQTRFESFSKKLVRLDRLRFNGWRSGLGKVNATSGGHGTRKQRNRNSTRLCALQSLKICRAGSFPPLRRAPYAVAALLVNAKILAELLPNQN